VIEKDAIAEDAIAEDAIAEDAIAEEATAEEATAEDKAWRNGAPRVACLGAYLFGCRYSKRRGAPTCKR
jgi:hypothetical protein